MPFAWHCRINSICSCCLVDKFATVCSLESLQVRFSNSSNDSLIESSSVSCSCSDRSEAAKISLASFRRCCSDTYTDVLISSTKSALTAASLSASNSSVLASLKAPLRASKQQAKPDTRAMPCMKLCRGILREKINGGASQRVSPDTDKAET